MVAVGNLRSAGRVALRAQQAVTVGTELERSAVNLENGLRGFVCLGSRGRAGAPPAPLAPYPRQVQRLKGLARDDRQLRADVGRVSTLMSDYIGLYALPFLEVAREDPRYARSYLDDPTGRRRSGRALALRTMFVRARAEADAHGAARRLARRPRRPARVIGIALVVLTALGAAAAAAPARGGPIQRVAGASAAIARGRPRRARRDRRAPTSSATSPARSTRWRRPWSARPREIAERTDELERSNRELEDYASVTSHDLQGPLVTIGMYAGLLSAGSPATPRRRRWPRTSATGSERMRGLTRDLLAYARLDREESGREPVDARRDAARRPRRARRPAARPRRRGPSPRCRPSAATPAGCARSSRTCSPTRSSSRRRTSRRASRSPRRRCPAA